MYITKQQDFDSFLIRANKSDVIAIDTEFLRDKTYWAKLCLLQMAIDDEFVLVDPFTVNIKSLDKIMSNNKIVKLFHSPRQDVEILLHKTGVLPEPIFDTQIAASFLGYGAQVGYANLVMQELGVKLDKGETYTDWSNRPLSGTQLKYAENDVTYLLQLYRHIVKKLKKNNRIDWVLEDINEKYGDRDLYQVSVDERFWHLRRITSLNARQMACAKEIAAWRENIAMKRNAPRRWVLSDDKIIAICKHAPKTINELFDIRGIKDSIDMSDARSILEALERGFNYKECDLPDINDKTKHTHKESINHEVEAEIDLMCAIVRKRAKENNIAAQTLSSNSDLSKIAHGAKSGIATLSGWRKKIVGNDLLKLVSGEISLKINKGKLEIIENKNMKK